MRREERPARRALRCWRRRKETRSFSPAPATSPVSSSRRDARREDEEEEEEEEEERRCRREGTSPLEEEGDERYAR